MKEGDLVRSSCTGSSARPQMEVVDPVRAREQGRVASEEKKSKKPERDGRSRQNEQTNQSLSTRLDAIQKEQQVVRLALAYKELEIP